MMNKQHPKVQDLPANDVLMQIDQTIHSNHKNKNEQKDDFDMSNVDSLMEDYDKKEKKQQQDEEFINVLKSDDKMLNFFVENYNPFADKADDEKFISYEFSKYSEQGWTEDGQKMNK